MGSRKCDEGCECGKHDYDGVEKQRIPLGVTKIDSEGYVRIQTALGWEFAHYVAMGVAPEDEQEVHHKDNDKTNNDPSNLCVTGSTWSGLTQSFTRQV